jgi:BirA family biotin operon repressor/biotin-[acetyl-CoA-carboxylase] ligase
VPRFVAYDRVSSTMDVAHHLAAAGTPPGTLVVAEEQVAGRGRSGRAWRSTRRDSLTFTLVERPRDARSVEVLSLRLGMRAAAVLDRWALAPVAVKWPNDLMVGDAKLAGILVEARWRGETLDWVAIGVGVNVTGAAWPGAASLAPGTSRIEVLAELIPALRAAAAGTGQLTEVELTRFAVRDWARGRPLLAPAEGVAAGITTHGELVIDTPSGPVTRASGSLILAEETGHAAGL